MCSCVGFSTALTHWGDTVVVTRWRTLWRDRLRVDSFVRRDTVTVVRTTPAPRLPLASRLRAALVGMATGALLVVLFRHR